VKSRTKFSVGFYAMVVTGLFLLKSYFIRPPIPEVSYSQFRSYLSEDTLQRVEIGRQFLHGTAITDDAERLKAFRTRRIQDDENLIAVAWQRR
tara:strand:+ start:436 stop:714 length:279 start_codon:yes stop_codon:yes gene_type:complete